MLQKAFEIATAAHQNQFRKTILKIPYIFHPIAVHNLLIACGEKDLTVLSIALLHDAIEDSDNREETRTLIEQSLGLEISNGVMALTLPEEASGKMLYGQLPAQKKELKYKHISETMLNGSDAVKKVKLADRYINVFDFIYAGEEKYAKKYFYMFLDACRLAGVPEFTNMYDNAAIKDPVYAELLRRFYSDLNNRFVLGKEDFGKIALESVNS